MQAISKNKRRSSSGATALQNLAVWEGGYNSCLEVCREADRFDQANVITQQLKTTATTTILHLSRTASYRLGKQYIRSLKDSYVSTKQMTTLLLLCHDLGYTSTEKFLELNSRLNEFAAKLLKYTRYCQKKRRKKLQSKR
jgi:four helix bundle protein